VHRNRDGQHPLAVFVSDLNDDLASVAFGKAVSADLSGSFGSLSFSRVQARELKPVVVGDERRAFANVEKEARLALLGRCAKGILLGGEVRCSSRANALHARLMPCADRVKAERPVEPGRSSRASASSQVRPGG